MRMIRGEAVSCFVDKESRGNAPWIEQKRTLLGLLCVLANGK